MREYMSCKMVQNVELDAKKPSVAEHTILDDGHKLDKWRQVEISGDKWR